MCRPNPVDGATPAGARRHLASQNLQTKMRLHRQEIPVVVQKLVAALDTERPDDHVDRLAHSDAASTQRANVPGGTDCQIRVEHGFYGKLPKRVLDPARLMLVAGA